MAQRNSVTLSQTRFFPRARDWPDPPTGSWGSPQTERDLFAHWEVVLWNDYNQAHAHGAVEWKNWARESCDGLQSSRVIKELCKECPHPYTHVVIGLLYDRRCSRRTVSSTTLRKQLAQEQRSYRASATKIGKIQEQLATLPAAHFPHEKRAAVNTVLEQYRQQAAYMACEGPAKISIRLLSKHSEITEKDLIVRPRGVGKPLGHGAAFNVFIALLVEFLEGISHDPVWSRRRALALLKHFEPDEFPPTYTEEALRRRIEQFRERQVHQVEIARTKTLFINVVNLRWPFPDFLNDSLRDRKDIPAT